MAVTETLPMLASEGQNSEWYEEENEDVSMRKSESDSDNRYVSHL